MFKARPADKLSDGAWFRWCGSCQSWLRLDRYNFYRKKNSGQYNRGMDTICKACWWQRNSRRCAAAHDVSIERKCGKCGETKSKIGGFYQDRFQIGGYSKTCKDCKRAISKEYQRRKRQESKDNA